MAQSPRQMAWLERPEGTDRLESETLGSNMDKKIVLSRRNDGRQTENGHKVLTLLTKSFMKSSLIETGSDQKDRSGF